jgi:hypothetical protein
MDTDTLESALAARGWRFDAESERFTDGIKRIDYRKILALMPGLTMDKLSNYVTAKHEEWLATGSRRN